MGGAEFITFKVQSDRLRRAEDRRGSFELNFGRVLTSADCDGRVFTFTV